MTINSNTRKAGPFVGNGVTTTFPFTFKVFAAADLLVVRVNTTTEVETTLVLGTDYSVTLNAEQNSSPGGNVVLTSALASGNNMIITSDIQNLQPTDLTNQGGFYPEVINDALDRATIQIQQLQEGVDRAAKLPITSDADSQTLVAAIIQVADSVDVIDTVAGSIDNVNTVAGISDDVAVVADNVSSVENFANVYYGPSATDPTTRQDGSALVAGDLYFNTVGSKMRAWTGIEWDDVGTASPVTISTQQFSGTGSQTTYTLSVAPAFQNACEVFISGVAQVPGVNYTVSDTTLTFVTAPPAGTNNIFVRSVSTYAGGVPNDGSVTPAKMSNGGPQWTAFGLYRTTWNWYDSASTSALNWQNGSNQRWAPSGTVTLSVSNWPAAGSLGELLIEGVNLGAATITWPTINWVKSDGTTTTTIGSAGFTLQSSGTDFVFLWTRNGGTTIYGKVVR